MAPRIYKNIKKDKTTIKNTGDLEIDCIGCSQVTLPVFELLVIPGFNDCVKIRMLECRLELRCYYCVCLFAGGVKVFRGVIEESG